MGEISRQYIASISYGKDSLAMVHVIKDILNLPLDRVVTVDLWATDNISADLPPMVEFKKHADSEIKRRYGIEVEHFCALNNDGTKKTFEQCFYTTRTSKSKYAGKINGWPMHAGRSWCNSKLKVEGFNLLKKSIKDVNWYIGIAADEFLRINKHAGQYYMTLVDAGWSEQMCYQWCADNGLLSPIYTHTTRGGCWFCINQSIPDIKNIREHYPDYYQLMLNWDKDVMDDDNLRQFRRDGHSLHDLEKRFQWEESGGIPSGKSFRWSDIDKF